MFVKFISDCSCVLINARLLTDHEGQGGGVEGNFTPQLPHPGQHMGWMLLHLS